MKAIQNSKTKSLADLTSQKAKNFLLEYFNRNQLREIARDLGVTQHGKNSEQLAGSIAKAPNRDTYQVTTMLTQGI